MNKRTTLLLTLFSIAAHFAALAQYQDAIHRQKTDDMRLFRDKNLKEQVMYIQKDGNSAPYGINYYDTGGRVVTMISPMHHEHFKYDDRGRMVYWLDSANDGRRFEKFEYHFGYDAAGKINAYSTSKTESKFTNAGLDVKEEVVRNGIVAERHVWSYNTDGKLTQELFSDTAGKLIHSRKLFYNKYGDLASEIVYDPIKDCKGDSSVTINTYDNKGRIIHKQRTAKTFKCGSSSAMVEKNTVNESISYNYNAAGLLAVEAMVCSDPSQSYRKEYVYTEEGIIFKELGFDAKGKSTTNITYSYVYYPKGR